MSFTIEEFKNHENFGAWCEQYPGLRDNTILFMTHDALQKKLKDVMVYHVLAEEDLNAGVAVFYEQASSEILMLAYRYACLPLSYFKNVEALEDLRAIKNDISSLSTEAKVEIIQKINLKLDFWDEMANLSEKVERYVPWKKIAHTEAKIANHLLKGITTQKNTENVCTQDSNELRGFSVSVS